MIDESIAEPLLSSCTTKLQKRCIQLLELSILHSVFADTVSASSVTHILTTMSAISRQQKVKGEAFISEAQSTLQKKTWFASGTEQKHEDAAELYQKAANAFKVGGFFKEAGDAYGLAASIYKDKLKNGMEASKALTESGHCYKKSDPKKAVVAYRESITMLCDAGRLSQAARLSKSTGELFENDDDEESVALAIESYQQAADLYEMEQQKSQASQCLVKIAELASAALNPPDLLRAAEIYEKLGSDCLESNLLKYNAKGYFLQCIMCHLANQDSVAAEKALSRFSSLDFSLRESREGKFAEDLIAAVEAFDGEGFATVCFEYDRIQKLDPWKTTLLLSIRKAVEGDGTGDDGEDDIDLT
jgi:alpha-soluble NSF attachment protein